MRRSKTKCFIAVDVLSFGGFPSNEMYILKFIFLNKHGVYPHWLHVVPPPPGRYIISILFFHPWKYIYRFFFFLFFDHNIVIVVPRQTSVGQNQCMWMMQVTWTVYILFIRISVPIDYSVCSVHVYFHPTVVVFIILIRSNDNNILLLLLYLFPPSLS